MSLVTQPPGASEPPALELPLIQYWDTDPLPPPVAELAASFHDHNRGLRHHIFNEAEAEQFIADHYGAREVQAFRTCALPPMQADYFRYCAVLALGGVYSDVDVRCLRGLDSLVDAVDQGELFQRVQGGVENYLFIFRHARHPLMEMVVEIATLNIERRLSEDIRMTTGPGIFTALHFLNEMRSMDAFLELTVNGRLDPSIRPFRGSDILTNSNRSDQGRRNVAALAEAVRDVVGDHQRVAEAFAGVEVSLVTKCDQWVSHPENHLPHKKTEAHWARFKSSLYK